MMQLYNGDCLQQLDNIPDDSIDMVLTDPPYSSGALHAGGRKASTKSKYCSTEFNGSARFQSFTGDNMDQRSLILFLREVFMGIRPKVKEGGILGAFIDWRNLPAMTDALQMAGFIWLGVVVWDKRISRPTPDRFRNDCEYLVWGSKGSRKAEMVKGCKSAPGCYSIPGGAVKGQTSPDREAGTTTGEPSAVSTGRRCCVGSVHGIREHRRRLHEHGGSTSTA